jgi:hypothetical protein
MLWTIFAILLIMWLLGWGFHVAGSLIHLLLVIALVVAVLNLVSGRRAFLPATFLRTTWASRYSGFSSNRWRAAVCAEPCPHP